MLAVLKFGGSSVADTKKIQTIATYLKERTAKGEKLIVVVSAMGKTTDALLSMAQNLSNSPNKRELDQLLAVGEQTTIALLAISLNQLGVKSQSFTGAQAGIHTNSVHTKGKIDQIDNTRLLQAFQEIDIAVVAGFQGIDELGNTTTLGRGGSDTTAVALAGAFEVKAEIYTDVEGVYRTDPRIYSNAKKIEKISYDEMMEMIDTYRDKFESVAVAEPLLGEVGSDATIINQDKEDVAKAVTAAAVKEAGYDSLDAAAADKVAFVFMGHGTSHTAKVSYSQMQTTMQTLGYDNVFIGTVEGKPEETACENVIEAVKAAGYTKVILRPLMVVAGDHANNDMAGEDADSWLSQFKASGAFDSIDCQIAGLGEIEDVQKLYVAHTKAAIDSLNG